MMGEYETAISILPLANGRAAELYIDGVLPRTKCFAQLDLDALVLRWSPEHFVCVPAIEDVHATSLGRSARFSASSAQDSERHSISSLLNVKMDRAASFFSASSLMTSKVQPPDRIVITFNDRGGISRVLELRSSFEQLM